MYADGPQPHGEDDPLDMSATGTRAVSVAGVMALEEAVLNPQMLEGIVLRYGHFYGPGSSDTPYNHCSLLRSLEDIFRLDEHLGYAADDPRSGYILDTIGNDKAVFEHGEDEPRPGHWTPPRF